MQNQDNLKLTPWAVQKYLRSLKYNKNDTLYSAQTSYAKKTVHCFEAALLAAFLLELAGYPPLVMSFESQDSLDHVVFVFKHDNKWGSVGRSRDEGLHGRKPVFRSLRDLAWSYFDPYIDKTGRILSYQVVHLDETQSAWRDSKKSVWKAERYLLNIPHIKLYSSDQRYEKLKALYMSRGPMVHQAYWW